MKVDRIGVSALQNLIKGELTDNATCIVKFYSQECPMCLALSTYYTDIADSYDDEGLFFFAFNIQDVEKIEDYIDLNGVPTIVSFRGGPNRRVKVTTLEDPETPNKKTWYYSKDIRSFVDKEKR